MNSSFKQAISKVPEVTLVFWVIKIIATTLGETGGDALSMSLGLGYLVSSIVFGVLFLMIVFAQVKARRFRPTLYWGTIIATTTLGTTLADFADRSLGIGYAGGSSVLFILLIVSLLSWHRVMGSIAIEDIKTPGAEIFYWVTIMFSQTLGTALGDWSADTLALGYLGAALVFGGLLMVVILAHFWTNLSKTILFWTAFVLTRPLGAVLGDYLDKPISHGGLELSRYSASAVLLSLILILIWMFPSRAAKKSH
ncbi:membrane protein [Methylovorus sp. MP688]|uniref:COG4705 family protein n=1 Tax=Methylovorus sp. (strain MP688) TaxID=887061 RepID=UPI00059DDD53|nr:membrane protein [Methylovorus sp. MP688]